MIEKKILNEVNTTPSEDRLMRKRITRTVFIVFIGLALSCRNTGNAQETNKALVNYINKPDRSYSLQYKLLVKTAKGSYYEGNFVSQTWQHIPWKHRLVLYIPAKVEFQNMVLLLLRHIANPNADIAALQIISDSTHTSSAMLYDLPNQPLFDGREEDDLQAFSFSQYIKTGDESWPLLFPMVKSVVRAMDAMQTIAEKENKQPINKFIITGHSKRGHTSWLTAAIDKRVKGIIPVAIDVLNATEQLPHHLEVFGEYSTPSTAATDLLHELQGPRGKTLIGMIDAYSYRKQLTIPKLIVSATNDPFFTTDALNLYWDGLVGNKQILYLSNANHISAYSDPRVNATAFAFVRAIANDKSMPLCNWKYRHTANSVILTITSSATAVGAKLWTSHSMNKDFRQSRWMPKSIPDITTTNNKLSKVFEIEIQNPLEGFVRVYGEVEFTEDKKSFILTTQTELIPQEKKY